MRPNTPTANEQAKRRGCVPAGCLLAPFTFVFRQARLFLILFVVVFAAIAACAIFAPPTFRAIIDSIRDTGYRVYTEIVRVTGNPALKLIVYEVDVTATAAVERQMGVLSLIWGEGAQVEGVVRIALGADLDANKAGIISCEIDTNTLHLRSGRAPLAGTAFNQDEIRQQALLLFKEISAKRAIELYWPEARRRLQNQFASWALGLEAPEVPRLSQCPSDVGAKRQF